MNPYYQDDAVTIYHGDCREFERVVADADCLLTDPPYPGREDLFDTEVVSEFLPTAIDLASRSLVFWPALGGLPAAGKHPDAIHVWHKAIPIHPRSKIGNVAGHHYERILAYSIGARCEVFRIAAIVPNFAACANELTPHPTQKPLELMRELVKRLPGRLILDPFMGSGSTLRAAKDMGRKAIGIEVEERYCEIAAERMGQEVLAVAS